MDAGQKRMLRLVQSVSVTEAKQTFALLVEAVEQSNEPVVITRRGDAAVVLMSLEAFEELNSSSSGTRSSAER